MPDLALPLLDLGFLIGVLALALGVVGFVAARRLRASRAGRWLLLTRIPSLVVGFVMVASAVFTPTPQTGLSNPVPRTVESVAIGSDVYLNSCSSCHGIDARGGGPLAPTTQVPPPPLVGPGSHLPHHTDGDLHYIIANGLPGGMPAWSGTLTDEQMWHTINFLRSLQETNQ